MNAIRLSNSETATTALYLLNERTFVLSSEKPIPFPSSILTILLDELSSEKEIILRNGIFHLSPIATNQICGNVSVLQCAAHLEGERPFNGDHYKREPSLLKKEKVNRIFRPKSYIRAFRCGKRHLFQLSKDMFLLDASDGSLAVHIIRAKELALSLLRREQTITSAKKQQGHVVCFRHNCNLIDRLYDTCRIDGTVTTP